ncbi:MAG: hypothetical protein KF901_21380 [Myxococcales bacterium]|nr:hypothetical protein [Myxococcales bacterium]
MWAVLGGALGCVPEASAPAIEEEAPSFRSEHVDAQLEAIARGVVTQGFQPDGQVWRGFLVDRGVDVSEQELRRGSCYVFLGAASSAVRHLALTVHDAEGVEVARAREHVALQFCPDRTSAYFVVLQATGSGLFAAQRFRGPTGLELSLDDVELVPR